MGLKDDFFKCALSLLTYFMLFVKLLIENSENTKEELDFLPM